MQILLFGWQNKYERMPFEVAKEAIDKILTSPEYFPEKK